MEESILKIAYERLQHGEKITKIARDLNVCRKTLTDNLVKSYNLKIPKKEIKYVQATPELLKQAYDMFLNDMQISEIANALGMERRKLGVKLKKVYNIEPLHDGKKAVNDYYFNVIDTAEKAYWLGFMYADGYVGKRNEIELALQYADLKHLEKFKKALSSKHKIGIKDVELNGKIFKACRISIKSDQLAKSLVRYGCFNDKSYIINFPAMLSENLYPHFIRGYFDGDGCMVIAKKICHSHADFTSGSIDMLKSLQTIFNKLLGITSSIYKDKRTKCVYRLQIMTVKNISTFLEYIYKNSDESIRLDRKYNKYVDFINS